MHGKCHEWLRYRHITCTYRTESENMNIVYSISSSYPPVWGYLDMYLPIYLYMYILRHPHFWVLCSGLPKPGHISASRDMPVKPPDPACDSQTTYIWADERISRQKIFRCRWGANLYQIGMPLRVRRLTLYPWATADLQIDVFSVLVPLLIHMNPHNTLLICFA